MVERVFFFMGNWKDKLLMTQGSVVEVGFHNRDGKAQAISE